MEEPHVEAIEPRDLVLAVAILSCLHPQRQKHSADHAVLIVGHANTVPELLVKLGAKADCFQRLGITGQPGSLMTETYDGLWRVDLKKQGCEAIERETQAVGK